MRSIALLPALVLAFAWVPPLHAQRTETPVAPDTSWRARVRAEVVAAEQRRRAAHLDQDADALAQVLAEDFVEVAVSAGRTRATNLADKRAGRVRWTRLVVTDEQVTVFDSVTAAVTGVLDGGGTYDGRPFTRHLRFLRVYLKRDGYWRNIAAANVPLPKEPAAVLGGTQGGAGALSTQGTEVEIRSVEQQWALASLHGDTASFNRLMAPDFRSIRTDGLVMTRVDRLRAFGSGDVRTTALEFSDMQVRVDGNTAIVTGLATRKDTAGGHPRDFQYRYTRVWQRRGGHWRVVNFQSTTVAPGQLGGLRSATPTADGRSLHDAPAPAASDSVAQELLATDRSLFQAAAHWKPEHMDSALAKEYVAINGAGNIFDKAGAMRLYAPGGRIKLDSSDVSDLLARVYGNVAVVTGVWHLAGTQDGRAHKSQMRYTHVWVWRDGRWQVASWQGTTIPDTAERRPDTSTTAQDDAQVLAAESTRRQALLRRDVHALDILLAPEFTNINSLNPGRVTSKAEELAFNQSVARQVQSWVPRDERVRVYGNISLITGLAEITDVLKGDRRHIVFQYSDIWFRSGGRWQLVHRHTNRVSTLQGPPPPASGAGNAAPKRTVGRVTSDSIARQLLAIERRHVQHSAPPHDARRRR